MTIQLEQPLKEYMKEKNQQHILITPMMCHTWGGSRLDISARFVDSAEAEKLKTEHFQSIPHELGSVLMRRLPKNMDDTVTLGLNRLFKTIKVKGIYSA